MDTDPSPLTAEQSDAAWSDWTWSGRPLEVSTLHLQTVEGLDCRVTEWRVAGEKHIVRIAGTFNMGSQAGSFDVRLDSNGAGLVFRDTRTGRIGSPRQLLPAVVLPVYAPDPGREMLAALKPPWETEPTPEQALAAKAIDALEREFGATKSEWGLACWLSGVNGFLGGRRPVDLLATDPELVLSAARDEMAGVQHG